MFKKLAKGYGLLEILLVLSIVSVILVLTMRFYVVYDEKKKVALFQSSAAQVMNALTDYYYINCHNPNLLDNVTVTELQQKGLLSQNINNPFQRFFTVSVENMGDTEKPFYVLNVLAPVIAKNTIYDQTIAAYLATALGGNTSSQGIPVVIWTKLPSQSTDELSSQNWVFGGNRLPAVTGVGAGTRSQLWVLNSNLQYFSRNADDPKLKDTETSCPN